MSFAQAGWQYSSAIGGGAWTSTLLADSPRLVHGFSSGRCNMAVRGEAGDDEARTNRDALCLSLGLDSGCLVLGRQVHGVRIEDASFAVSTAEMGQKGPKRPRVDGWVSCQAGIVIGALTADCPVILAYDPVRHCVGLVHAGWRGTVGGISVRLVEILGKLYSSQPGDLITVIGPSAGPCCYEVGDQVIQAVGRRPNRIWGKDPSGSESCLCERGGKAYFDLWAANALQLQTMGVFPGRIGLPGLCTICDRRFYSYRRSGPGTGHGMMVAALR